MLLSCHFHSCEGAFLMKRMKVKLDESPMKTSSFIVKEDTTVFHGIGCIIFNEATGNRFEVVRVRGVVFSCSCTGGVGNAGPAVSHARVTALVASPAPCTAGGGTES